MPAQLEQRAKSHTLIECAGASVVLVLAAGAQRLDADGGMAAIDCARGKGGKGIEIRDTGEIAFVVFRNAEPGRQCLVQRRAGRTLFSRFGEFEYS